MAFTFRMTALLLATSSLASCYVPQNGYGGYGRSYSGNFAPPPAYAPTAHLPPPTPTALPSAAADAPPLIPASPPPSAVAAAATATPPALDPPPAAGAVPALPPLILPVRQDWSSAKCPDLAVTFTGDAEDRTGAVAETASFEETRQYRDGDYAEVAECFCAKTGNLGQTSKSAADAVMSQTARQFADQTHLKVRQISYVESSPLGSFSQLEAGGDDQGERAIMRIYWRGQCSVRLAAVSSPATDLRAAEFLASLRLVGTAVASPLTPAPEAEAPPPAYPVPPITSASLPAASATTQDLEQELRQKLAVAQGTQPAPIADRPVPVADHQLTPNAVARLKQIQDLKKKGLISPAEYEDKRAAIMNEL